MPSTSPLEVDLISALKLLPVGSTPTVVLLVGAVTLTDGLGGFYRWDGTSSTAEDARFWNVVASSMSSTGRWVRIFQRVRTIGAGYLVSNGGFKEFFMPGVLNSAGQVTVYLTDDGTATGNALFTEVWTTQGDASGSASTANGSIVGSKKSISADSKTLVYQFVQGASVTVGILGVVVPGLTAAPSGTPVVVRASGI